MNYTFYQSLLTTVTKKHMRCMYVLALLLLGLSVSHTTVYADLQQFETIPVSPPSGLARDHQFDAAAAASGLGALYEQVIDGFVPVMEAEKRAFLSDYWTGWYAFNPDAIPLLLRTVDTLRTFLLDEARDGKITAEGGQIIPYPNTLNAKYWQLYPATAGVEENYRISLLPLPDSENPETIPSLFPLKEQTQISPGLGNGEAKEINTFSETFARMLRFRQQGPSCVAECVEHPLTGVRADRHMTLTEGLSWDNVVLACADRGGRLPRAEEAWLFLTSLLWQATPEEAIQMTSWDGYYVLTSDVLEIEDNHKSDEGYPAFALNAVEVLGVKVGRNLQPGKFFANGFNYAIDWNAMTQLASSPYSDYAQRHQQYLRSVYYCIYD